MDLILDPLRWAEQDPEQPGIFQRTLRVSSGDEIGVMYVIASVEARLVSLVDVRFTS